MVADARGSFYEPSPAPQSGGERALREWLRRELDRIAAVTHYGRSELLTLDVLAKLPAKPFAGMVAFFKAGVAGASEGLYEYRGGAWNKL